MEEQLIKVDSIADLRVALEDAVGLDAVVNVGAEVLPEEPEGEALDEVGDLAAGVFAEIDVGTPSRRQTASRQRRVRPLRPASRVE